MSNYDPIDPELELFDDPGQMYEQGDTNYEGEGDSVEGAMYSDGDMLLADASNQNGDGAYLTGSEEEYCREQTGGEPEGLAETVGDLIYDLRDGLFMTDQLSNTHAEHYQDAARDDAYDYCIERESND
ncbi:hypothetical protein [Gloeobacter violaceus]|uniref:Glr4090 protein n=1 Tax=Gloeobacter violaceus (strain ATCC 29082 / PCC 7421) TaxID=251221 RepID=Q7NDZ2_GLOVI|nr:hypothetical protein [Gloeobacter violaceus]BAC92031.1 glr4090 [Gloeobacter violaceus PCC 7421]